MLIDLMSPYKSQTFNIKLAHIVGLNTAVYWGELMNIYARVIDKKLEETVQNNGYFDLDRTYITKRTTLSISDQLVCDKALLQVGIIDYDGKNVNKIRIDLGKMREIIEQDDPEELAKLERNLKVKTMDAASAKRTGLAQTFKNLIVESDPELLNAYYIWIDTIIMDKKDFLNKTIVDTFVKTVREFTDNKETQLKVIETATISGWKNASWACDSVKKLGGSTGAHIGKAQKSRVEIDLNSGF